MVKYWTVFTQWFSLDEIFGLLLESALKQIFKTKASVNLNQANKIEPEPLYVFS